MKTLRYPVFAGINIERCPVNKGKPHQCSGLMEYHITPKDAAKIRSGQAKAFMANFSCKHHDDTKIVVHK